MIISFAPRKLSSKLHYVITIKVSFTFVGTPLKLAQSAGAAEHTDYIFAEE